MESVNTKLQLIKLLQTYKKNRDAVSLKELKTKYKAGYEALCKEMCLTASEYVKELIFKDIRIHKEFLEEGIEIINQTIALSGMGKKFGHAIFEEMDLSVLDGHAMQLREMILTDLEPFYFRHICLYITSDCLQEPYNTPAIYNEVTGLFLEDNEWVKKENQNTGILLFLRQKQTSTAS